MEKSKIQKVAGGLGTDLSKAHDLAEKALGISNKAIIASIILTILAVVFVYNL